MPQHPRTEPQKRSSPGPWGWTPETWVWNPGLKTSRANLNWAEQSAVEPSQAQPSPASRAEPFEPSECGSGRTPGTALYLVCARFWFEAPEHGHRVLLAQVVKGQNIKHKHDNQWLLVWFCRLVVATMNSTTRTAYLCYMQGQVYDKALGGVKTHILYMLVACAQDMHVQHPRNIFISTSM